MGLVAQVFAEEEMQALPGHIAVGHNRYSTAGGLGVEHAQPIVSRNGEFALAHNGNLPTTKLLREFLSARGTSAEDASDSELIVYAISEYIKDGDTLEDAVRHTYPMMTGAFSIIIMGHDCLIAIRDYCGIRPLALGRVNGGWVLASETCALHTIKAHYERDVAPGEMLIINAQGLRSEQLASPNPKLDIFEFVYFARPDSELLGRSVYEVRSRCGTELARESRVEVDIVIPVPETAIPVAIGCARELGVPFEFALAKNRYIHRTFIQPEQRLRYKHVEMKLTTIRSIIKGKRVAVVDDSIVRGTTSRKIVKMLYDAGATEVHFLVSSPPVKFPDFYGIDTPTQSKLIGATKTTEEIREFLGATSLHYLSLGGLIKSIGVPEDQLNTSCFTGVYPIDIGERASEIRIV
jgi:amidophosphoribosyltransferase